MFHQSYRVLHEIPQHINSLHSIRSHCYKIYMNRTRRVTFTAQTVAVISFFDPEKNGKTILHHALIICSPTFMENKQPLMPFLGKAFSRGGRRTNPFREKTKETRRIRRMSRFSATENARMVLFPFANCSLVRNLSKNWEREVVKFIKKKWITWTVRGSGVVQSLPTEHRLVNHQGNLQSRKRDRRHPSPEHHRRPSTRHRSPCHFRSPQSREEIHQPESSSGKKVFFSFESLTSSGWKTCLAKVQ